MEDLARGDKKAHRKAKSGAKADKKKANDKKKRGVNSTGDRNHKAFSVHNIVRTKRNQQRNRDIGQRKEVVPLKNREEDLPPPVLVCVMGPAGVGKSTLIRSLVKIYTGQNIQDTKGPITVVVSRKRRVTFFECPLDMCSMTDLAKVADLVLLLVDASYGFEMETFEFLNMLQLHGFPKVLGVLTHLDSFKANKAQQTAKKVLKGRFWTEIYKGAKMFEMSGCLNGKYLKHEVKRLSLYVGRIKFRPLVWRNSHPYALVDRVEDATPAPAPGQPYPDKRSVAVYGYLRGTHLKQSTMLHLIGAGDFRIASITALEDPCPMPGQKERNSLKVKDNLLYAPMANVGRLTMDRSGMFIDIKNVYYTDKDQLEVRAGETLNDGEAVMAGPAGLLKRLQGGGGGGRAVDEQMLGAGLSLFTGSSAVTSKQVQGSLDQEREHDGYSDDDGDDEEIDDEEIDDDDDDDDDDEEEEEEGEEEEEEEEEEGEEDGDMSEGEEEEMEEGANLDDDENDQDQDEDDDDDDDSDDDDDDDDDEEEEEGEEAGDEEEEEEDEEDEAGEAQSSSGAAWKQGMRSRGADTFLARRAGRSRDLMSTVYGSEWLTAGGADALSRSTGNSDSGSDSGSDDELFQLKKAGDPRLDAYARANSLDSSRGSAQQARPQPSSSGSSSGGAGGGEKAAKADGDALRMRFVTSKEGWAAQMASQGQGKGKGAAAAAAAGGEEEEVFGDFEDLQTGERFGPGGAGKHASKSDNKKKKKQGGGGASDSDASAEEEEEEDGEDGSGYDSDQQERENARLDEELRALNASKKAQSREAMARRKDSQADGEDGDEPAADGDGDGEDGGGGKKGGKKGKGMSAEDVEEQRWLDKAQKELQEQRQRNKEEFGGEGEHARLQLEGFRQGLYVRMVLADVPAEFLQHFRPQLPVVLGGLLPHEMAMGFVRARVKRHRWHRRVLKSNDPLIFSVGWRRFQSLPVYAIEDVNDRQRYLKYTPEHMHCVCTFYGPLVPPNTGILAFQSTSATGSAFRVSLTGTALELQASSDIVKKLKLVGTPKKVFKNTAFVEGMFNSALEVSKFTGAKLKTVSGIRGAIKRPLKEGTPGSFRAAFEDKPLLSDIVICRLWVPVPLKAWYNPVTSMLDAPGAWVGARTVGQIRREDSVAQQVNKDSVYKPVERKQRDFRKLVVPNKLQAELPFASKPKQQAPVNRQSYVQRRQVVLEPEERKQRAALQTLQTIRKDKLAKRHQAQAVRKENKAKETARETARFADVHREEKKRKYASQGKDDARKKAKEESGRSKGKGR